MTSQPLSRNHFRPVLTLQTLTRGDGLLGMKPSGPFGPRGGHVTVVRIAWTYVTGDGEHWQIPAPTALLNRRPASSQYTDDQHGQHVLLRDLAAEADALDRVWELGLHPLPAQNLQWRTEAEERRTDSLWTLIQEEFFSDFWADQLPILQAEGWSIAVLPGFAHESVPVDAWHLKVSTETGEILSKEVAARMRGRPAAVTSLSQPSGASWLLTLGIEIAGETLDLTPLLANLIQRDARWLDANKIALIDDEAVILLRAPGGKRIEARAAPLKAIVRSMLDLLSDPGRKDGPLRLSAWDAYRLDAMRLSLLASQRQRAGVHGAWQLRGDAGLRDLAQRLSLASGPKSINAPSGLGVTLRPYQLHGVAWLQYLREQHLGGILADDMGLGKTAQALAHLLIEQQSGRMDRPALIVLPTSLIFNWQAEAKRMAPSLRVLTLQGPNRQQDFDRMASYDIVLTTYPLLWRDRTVLEAQHFHILILDEAQTVKNAAARSANAVRRIDARHRLCITGTPLENHLGELWTQFDFLMPGFLGDARSFTRLWRKPIEAGGETLRAQLLAQRVRPFILRRRKDEVATELPPKTEVIKRVQLQGHQRDLYESVRVAADENVRRILKRKGFTGGQITILDALLKLRQVCCDPYLLKGVSHPGSMERAKLDLLRDMLPALVAEGRRILVFSQFTELLHLIAEELDRLALPWLALTGRTPPAKRGALIAQFQSKTIPILLISLKAGGVGLNLTAADTVIHMDPWWNPAVEEQATARAHRIGQEHPVFVYKLLIEGSIEERILDLQGRKAALAEGVLGRDGALASKFTPEDLQLLLAPLHGL
ncbi:DEAD/DEAH box helicase [Glaciimonas immobilis]|uniref:Superfamily II DNA or RNA helicase n=1 Tax=Glaciimonas immobilis TaxID=728004 RepID=A0A840RXJ7_9BURK|nr:DEAD/DEAH box helicase [Glaciimonas immobilis]KAF3996277.1 DEAD/DEAH box helicase [Glaciimonas immobilis]MBB5202303.1 superfamily II DNA or RNA helicase [Glaciimonas immobilis]